MKKYFRASTRLAAAALAALLVLQLTGCSWHFMPGPVIVTDEVTTETPSQEEPSGELSSEVPSSAPEDSTAASSAAPSSETPTKPSSAEHTAEPAPTTKAPTEPAPTTEAPTEESTVTPETFTIDYFRIPDSLRKVADSAALVDAHNVVSACLAYKTSAKVNCSKEDAGLVLYLADTFCPLLKAFTNVSEDSWSDGTISWEFYVDKVEFSIIRAEFEQQVAAYIEPTLNGGWNETERALLLYHAYTAPASYNYEIISGSFKTYTEAEQHRIHSAFAGIMDHTGVCHDLAGGMTFLFIQAGFDACRVSVINKDEEHSWTLICLKGRYTYCDATWDVGGSFSYFGNSARERTTSTGGSFKLSEMNIYDLNAPANFTIVNPGFKKVQNFSLSYTGTLMNLTINTKAEPDTLRITNTRTKSSVTINCP